MDKVICIKNELDNQLLVVLKSPSVEEYNKLLPIASHFFTEFEEYIFRNSNSHNRLSNTQTEDILNSIKNIFDFVLKYNETVKELSTKLGISFSFSTNFLSTTQSIYKKYRQKDSKEYMTKFHSAGIPINGFTSKKKLPLQTRKFDFLSVIIGTLFFVTSFAIGFTKGIQSSIQYFLIRIAVSAGIALLFSGLGKDIIETKFKLNRLKITAYGVIAIFLIMYFVNPAKPPEYRPASEINKTEEVKK
jgi:hypothetical protein